jgi:ribosomal-protein-serine acetyltransferase
MNPIVVDRDLELRLLAQKHAAELFALTDSNRAHLREWLPWLDGIRRVSDTAEFIAKADAVFRESRAFTVGIWQGPRLAGVIGHNRIDWDNRVTQFGYWLAAAHQGRGIITRCCRALIDHAFIEYALNRIEIQTAVANHRSESIPKRLGFAFEGIRREGEWLYDHFVDLRMYALLRSTWAVQQAQKGRHV